MVATETGQELKDSDFKNCFEAAALSGKLLVAVSGGPDSIALMHGLAIWGKSRPNISIAVATVDHGLRAQAAQEAADVGEAAARLGLSHKTLHWLGPHPQSGIQEAARTARYALLSEWALSIGAETLITAHTLDDQAETVLMRMAHGSGLAGLAGMSPRTIKNGIGHVRPFLTIAKEHLVATCRARGWAFVVDPSNANPIFARSRWRALAPILAQEGLDAATVARLSERCRRADEALALKAADIFVNSHLVSDGRNSPPNARLMLDGLRIMLEPEELAIRVLALALRAVPNTLPPRLERLEECQRTLRTAIGEKRRIRRSLAGTLITVDKTGRIVLSDEPPRTRGRRRTPPDPSSES